MKSSRTMSMHRTGTMPISLPKINKLNIKQSRYNNNTNILNRSSFNIHTSRSKHAQSFIQSKSPFTARVEQQVLEQQEYPYIETSKIQKQQLRLKQLLKSFNQQTVNILQKYIIDKPIKKQYVKKKPPVQVIKYVREKQGENSMNMILLMKRQIQKLQSRCEDLKYMSREQFQYKIKELKEQKGKIIMENKSISRSITLNGLEMVRGKESQVKELQYEQFLIDSKRDRLRRQSSTVEKQLRQLQQKTKQLSSQIQHYEQTQSYTLKVFEELQRQKSQNRLYQEYKQKQRYYQHLKVLSQSSNYQLKHKYFQKLKLLDQSTTVNDQLEDRHTLLLAKIENAMKSIKQLQGKRKYQLNLDNDTNTKDNTNTNSKDLINSNMNINKTNINNNKSANNLNNNKSSADNLNNNKSADNINRANNTDININNINNPDINNRLSIDQCEDHKNKTHIIFNTQPTTNYLN